MRYFLLCMLVLAFCGAYSQKNCSKNSILYRFDKTAKPRHFTERLGNHPEFPFLQRMNGVNTVDAFLAAINDHEKQSKWDREFKAFDLLLRNSGFTNGYKDLTAASIEKVYVQRGIVGNLGFYDRVSDRINYIYVILSPEGEESMGTAAWKLTNKNGCYLYVLHTCGNAFYPENDFEGECCKTMKVQSSVTPLELKDDTVNTQVKIGIRFYQGQLVKAKKKSGKLYDTLVDLIRQIDTTVSIKTSDLKKYKIYANEQQDRILVCVDSVVRLTKRLLVDSSSMVNDGKPIVISIADTSYLLKNPEKPSRCNNNIEITIDGGMALNSTPPPIRSVDHTKSNGMSFTGEFGIGKIIKPWFTMGISASYIILSYQDDVPYPGSVPGTYNTVYLGKPIIPLQVFAKFTIGKEVGWQSIISLAAGYGIPTGSKIENQGNTLTTDPNVQGGLTAGLKLGVNYFPTCHFGLGLAFTGQFFSNQSTVVYSNLFALPITAGLRFRF